MKKPLNTLLRLGFSLFGLFVIAESTHTSMAENTPVYTYRIVNEYPHNPDSFTQGLVYHQGYLYEGTGLRGQSKLMKTRLETGEAVQTRELPFPYFGEGIALLGDKLYQLTWTSQKGFVLSLDDFSLRGEFSYPTEGWGLTHDGELLIMSDGTSTLYIREPETFNLLRTVTVRQNQEPVIYLNELEYIEGEVWANIWTEDYIARIDPKTGQVAGIIDFTGIRQATGLPPSAGVLNGIAYDAEGGRIFITGKNWPKLFEINVQPQSSSVGYWNNQ